MALDKLRVKCYLGTEIRVITARKEVSEDELLRIMDQEFGRPIVVRGYEDHEHERVTISANGLQAALTEHVELSQGPYLKLFLQYKPEDSYTLSHSGSSSNINVSVSSIGSTGSNGSHSSSISGRGMNGHIQNGINGHLGNPKRNSSNYSVSSNDSSSSTSSTNIHYAPAGKLEIDLNYIDSANHETNVPYVRTPPRTPPDSPKYTSNQLRTPPSTPPPGRKEGNEDGGPKPNFQKKILHIDTETNDTSTTSSPRDHNRSLSPSMEHPHHYHPHYHPHHEQDNMETTGSTRSNDTPPIRTPPPSPRPQNPSPPSDPWSDDRSPVLNARNQKSPTPPPLVHEPPHPVIPFPLHFHPQRSPRIGSPKLPPSILQQSEHEEENNRAIKWEKGPVIGRGGFGCVYMGMCDNGELIAVKQLELDENEDAKSKAMVQSFAQEIDVMKGLRHENIVRYLGVQVEDKYLNILLEYVPSGSISYLLGKFSKFPEPAIRVYTKQILQGLAYLHDHRIVHRDVKGANILVDKNGTVKLADFGCSKIFAGLKSQLKTVLGTPFWMAPEVIKQSGYGRSADIWSLGCVIIEMATGQPPWQSQFSEVTAAMFHIASTDAVPEMPPNLSSEAHDFLSLCFKRVPKERPNAKTLLKHPFLQDTSTNKDSIGRRNSFHAPPVPLSSSPSPSAIPSQVKNHNRAPSTSTPPIPVAPFTFADSVPPASHKYHKLDMLPTKLVLTIFRKLSIELQATMRLVCRSFAKMIKEDVWTFAQITRTRSATGGSASSETRKMWAEDKITITTLKGHTKPIHCLGLCDSFVASGGEDKKIKVWDAKKGKRLFSLQGHTSTVTGLCVDKSNNVFSSSADISVKIWTPFKTATPKKTAVLTLTGHTQPLTGIALVDSNTKLITSSYDKSVKIWDAVKGVALSTLQGHDGAVLSVAGSEGHVVISASSDQSLKVWDIRSNTTVKTLTGHIGEVKCCYFAYDRLVSGGDDKQVRVWDIGSGKATKKFDHAQPVTSVICDQSKVVSSGDKIVKLWEKDNETRAVDLKTPIFCLATDDIRLFAGCQDKCVRILSPDTPTTTTATTPKPFFSRFLG